MIVNKAHLEDLVQCVGDSSCNFPFLVVKDYVFALATSHAFPKSTMTALIELSTLCAKTVITFEIIVKNLVLIM